MGADVQGLIEGNILTHPISRRGDRMKIDEMVKTVETMLVKKPIMNGGPPSEPDYCLTIRQSQVAPFVLKNGGQDNGRCFRS